MFCLDHARPIPESLVRLDNTRRVHHGSAANKTADDATAVAPAGVGNATYHAHTSPVNCITRTIINA